MQLYLLIAAGGALGSVGRFALSGWVGNHWGETFPWATLIVNVTGSFLIGFLATVGEPEGRWFLSGSARYFFLTGVLGGYTTFSSFSLQTLQLAREGEWLRAGANSVLSLIGCLVAVWLGYLAAVWFNQLKAN